MDPLWRPGTQTANSTEDSNAAAGTMSLAELQDRKSWGPNGVEPSTREMHLSEEEFQQVGMEKARWDSVPRWKRDSLKKTAGIY